MSSEFKKRAIKGLVWSGVERFSNQGVQFLFSIVLARILMPSDYGITAMIMIFFNIAQTFIDSGFASALIRKKNRTQNDMSTCFFFNLILGLFFYCLLFVCAPFIADFYNLSLLERIVRISGITVFFNSLCIVQQARFTFQINFKSQAKITLISTFFSGLIGVFLAYHGFGVWALVWQGVIAAFIRMCLLWIKSSWRPSLVFSKESFSYLFGYGSKLLASGLLNTIFLNIYPIVIGKYFSAAQLGLFSRANGWAELPSANITGIIQRVTFPMLSEIQDEPERLTSIYQRIIRFSAFVIFPIMMGLASIASPLIRVVVTEKWNGCILLLQILCFSLMWFPIHAINLSLLQVKGRSDLFLRLEIIKKIVLVVILCITIPIGVSAMCVGAVFSSLISLGINTYYTGKIIKLGFFAQMKDLVPIFFNSVLMGLLAYLVSSNFSIDIVRLIIGIIFCIIYYMLSSRFLLTNEYNEFLHIIKINRN